MKESENKEENKENKINNNIDINSDKQNVINEENKNSEKNKDNIDENNINIKNKYNTEVISSNILFNGDITYNPFSKSSSTAKNNNTLEQKKNENNNINIYFNKNNNNNNSNLVEKNQISFSLRNIEFNNTDNNQENEQNIIHKTKPINNEENKNNENIQNILTFNNHSETNNLNNSQLRNNDNINRISDEIEKIDDNDKFKEFLISENKNLKKEVNNYEQLIDPLINYINNINRKFDQKEINPKDIKTIVKSNEPSIYIKNLEVNLNNSKEDINLKIDQMNSDKDNFKVFTLKNLKLNNPDNAVNNIKIKKININNNKGNEDQDYGKNVFNYGKGNLFYENKSDKYFYDYYNNRNINCQACIIGNNNSERGFSPLRCFHLDD